jgi:hypothetical protein
VAASGILKDTYEATERPYALNASFNAFGAQLKGNAIIDHIFTTNNFSVKKWEY